MPPSRTATRWSTGKWIAAILAVAVHLGFVVFLIFSVTWQNSRPEAVSVELYAPPAAVPDPVLPGAWTGSPARQRGQVSGPGSYVGRSRTHSAASG